MLRHKPKRKLLLPAGIVSLSLLSFLCIEFILQQLAQKNSLRVLDVVAWDPRDSDQINPDAHVTDKFTKIRLTGTDEDKDKLRLAKKAIHKIMQGKDTTLGFEFTFGAHAKYTSLVELCSICKTENVPSFFCHGDKFWILNVHPKPRNRLFLCGTYNARVRITQKNAATNFKWILSTRLIPCLVLLGLLLMLIVASVRKAIKVDLNF